MNIQLREASTCIAQVGANNGETAIQLAENCEKEVRRRLLKHSYPPQDLGNRLIEGKELRLKE